MNSFLTQPTHSFSRSMSKFVEWRRVEVVDWGVSFLVKG